MRWKRIIEFLLAVVMLFGNTAANLYSGLADLPKWNAELEDLQF